MPHRSGERGCTSTVLRAGAFVLLAAIFVCPTPAIAADVMSLEAGIGVHHSGNSEAVFLRYQIDAPLLLGLDGYYEASLGAWNGSNRAGSIGISRGVQWFWGEMGYLAGSAGMAYLTETTDNLGTRFQFLFRAALGRRGDQYDFSLGYVHYSNGKYFFGWDGPNYGENYITLQLGRLF